MDPHYRIKDVWRCGIKRWLVLLGDKEVARFELKREAIEWAMAQWRRESQS
jgi:hypothetical protein